MSSEANPIADSSSPTVNELILLLRSSFFPHEFDYVAKTLTDREECMKQKCMKVTGELKMKEDEIDDLMKANADVMREFEVYEKGVLEIIELRKKGEEEKGLLVLMNGECEKRIRAYEKRSSDDLAVKLKVEKEKKLLVVENLKLVEELETKRNEIDAVLKVNAEYEGEIAVYRKRFSDDSEFRKKAEEEKKVTVLENLKLNDELKARRDEIDAVMKVKADYETRYLDELALKLKAEEEKKLLDLENLKLNDELKARRDEIDVVKAECEGRIRDYGTRYLDELTFKLKAEEEKQLMVLELKARRNEIDVAMQAKTIAENEKKQLDLENVKLFEELKKKENEIDAVNSEHESKFRAYEKQCLELKMKNEAMVHANAKLNDKLQRKQSEIDAVNSEHESKFRAYEKQCLELKMKNEAMVNANAKLNDKLQRKQSDIDALTRRNAEYESKIRAFESKSLESDAKVLSSEKIVMETDCAVEGSRKVSEKERSKRKIEHALREIIEIDDDDDDRDLESVSRTKRRQACNEKTELKYTSQLFKTCRNKK